MTALAARLYDMRNETHDFERFTEAQPYKKTKG